MYYIYIYIYLIIYYYLIDYILITITTITTTGLKSKTSDIWVERRANFTKSMAVMSMAGYILGLGDRHPSNLMLDRLSGRVVHIDFGDCFEITSQRSKFPEIIPFRLTRMLTTCMGPAGIQGAYRLTCERVS